MIGCRENWESSSPNGPRSVGAGSERYGIRTRTANEKGEEGMKSGVCPKCSSRDIIEAKAAEYGGGAGFEVPMAVTAEPRWFLKWLLPSRDPRRPKGLLVMYVCRDCGYTEWYALDPKSIPIGPEWKTKQMQPSQERET
jgi:predicted nucleic-acid-binding Zn-ribbon protein